MGVHRRRLRGSKAHRFFVNEIKTLLRDGALEKFGREIPVSEFSPRDFDGQLLPIPVPPTFEEAFGYRGTLRFVEFAYSKKPRQFVYCDGGDFIPSDGDLWIRFLRHPAIAPHLPERRYPTLYGVFPRGKTPSLKEIWKGRVSDLDPECPHCLLLDREKRELYVCRTNRTVLLFALTEPEDADGHWAYRKGLFYPVNPAAEDYKVRPREELAAELTSFLDGWLDASLDDDFEETAADSGPKRRNES